MPNTKKQYAGGKRPGKTTRFFKAFATGSTTTKISVQDTERKTKKLHASEQKLKGFESQIKRTQKAANTHVTTKTKLSDIKKQISDMEFKFQQNRYNKKQTSPQELKQYHNFKVQRSYLQQELKKSKSTYYEHLKLKTMKGMADMKVTKRRKTVKAYEKAVEKLALEQFNKKRLITGWDKKYKKASIAEIHKFINVDSKLDTFKTITDSDGKTVKKLLKLFEFDDFRMHPGHVNTVIDSFPGVKAYSAKIGIDIDGLNENQRALLAHKMTEITKNPDITEREMAVEMVKSVVVTKFTNPEIKKEVLGYVAAPPELGNPAPGYNPGASNIRTIHPNGNAQAPNKMVHNYLEPTPVNKPYAGYELVPENVRKPYGNVEYSTASAAGPAKEGPVYNTASPGPNPPIYNNPAALANNSARANPTRTGTIKVKRGPNNAGPNSHSQIYANMAGGELIYNIASNA